MTLAALLLPSIPALPLVGAGAVRAARQPGAVRRVAAATAAATFLLAATLGVMPALDPGAGLAAAIPLPWGGHAFAVDGASRVLVPVYALLTLIVTLVAPRPTGPAAIAILLTESAVLTAFTTGDLAILAAAWTASGLPLLLSMRGRIRRRAWLLAAVALVGTGLMVGAAATSLALAAARQGVAAPWALPSAGVPSGGAAPFALLMVAVMLREGMIPFQSWLPATFGRGPLPLTVLVVGAHLGAYVVVRAGIPLAPPSTGAAIPRLTDLALATALYASFVGLAQTRPRRLLALLAIGQGAFLIAGLGRADPGATDALPYWVAAALASVGMVLTYAQLEARLGELPLDRFHGAAARTPRLAALFALHGLALAGLPGTLGFVGEHLLVHGALGADPGRGALLIAAAGLNALHVLRLFARLFLGAGARDLPRVADLRGREGAALGLSVVVLVALGLLPRPLLSGHAEPPPRAETTVPHPSPPPPAAAQR